VPTLERLAGQRVALVEGELERVVGHLELAEQRGDHLARRGAGRHVQNLGRVARQEERRDGALLF